MRILITIILSIAAFITPWWLTLVALIISVLLYRRFFLALVPAVIMDILHGGATMIEAPLLSATLIVGLLILLRIWI